MRDVFVFWHYSTVRGLVCVHACECDCCLLSLSKLEWPEDAQQPMKGKPGDIVRDIGRLWVSNDQSTVWQPSLSGNNGALFAELRCPCPAPNHFFINREAPTFAHKVLQWRDATEDASTMPIESLYLTVIYRIPAWVFSHSIFCFSCWGQTEGFILLSRVIHLSSGAQAGSNQGHATVSMRRNNL